MHHDCVIIPGFGALVTRYVPAYYDETKDVVTAPCRELSFNGDITFDDGLIASSISRRDGVRYTEAVRIVTDEVSALRAQLDFDGQFLLGTLGRFVMTEGAITFEAESADYRLKDIYLKPQSEEITSDDEQAENVVPMISRFSSTASRIAAAVAIIFIAGFTLYNPARVGEGVMKASFLPDLRVSMAADDEIPTNDIIADFTDVEDITVVDEIVESEESVTSEESVVEADLADPLKTNHSESVVTEDISDYKYYLIVASLPTNELAEQFISDNSLREASILIADGRYRVWVKAGNSYSSAVDQDLMGRFPDAWVYNRK